MAKKTHAARIVADIIKRRRDEFGGGWDHLSPEIRTSLVARQILAVTVNQDESVSADRVVAFTRELAAEMRRQMEG